MSEFLSCCSFSLCFTISVLICQIFAWHLIDKPTSLPKISVAFFHNFLSFFRFLSTIRTHFPLLVFPHENANFRRAWNFLCFPHKRTSVCLRKCMGNLYHSYFSHFVMDQVKRNPILALDRHGTGPAFYNTPFCPPALLCPFPPLDSSSHLPREFSIRLTFRFDTTSTVQFYRSLIPVEPLSVLCTVWPLVLIPLGLCKGDFISIQYSTSNSEFLEGRTLSFTESLVPRTMSS